MTKEEILCKHIGGENPEDLQMDLTLNPALSNILQGMEEYASQTAISFSEWAFKENWTIYKHPNVWSNEFEDSQILTTAELYSQFLEHQNKQQ